MDFGLIRSISPLTLIEEHAKTPWHVARFGGGLPPRPAPQPVPDQVAANETTYVRALLDAYAERLRCLIATVDALTDGTLMKYLCRSRHEFYSAEALREFSKDTVPPYVREPARRSSQRGK